MATNKIPAGADVKATLTLKDSQGSVINLNAQNVIEAKVKLCNEHTSQEWTENPTAEEKQLTVVDAANGKVSFLIDRVWNSQWKGKLFEIYATVIYDRSGDTDYPEEEEHLKGKLADVIKIEDPC